MGILGAWNRLQAFFHHGFSVRATKMLRAVGFASSAKSRQPGAGEHTVTAVERHNGRTFSMNRGTSST
jgi:hypothetical protein